MSTEPLPPAKPLAPPLQPQPQTSPGRVATTLEDVHEDATPHDLRPTLTVEALAEQIRETAGKLVRDGANIGDAKLLSTALKELRYSFKVFAPYRHMRKITVFGSARLPPTDPAYAAAEEFGRRMAEHDWMTITGAASGIMEAGH